MADEQIQKVREIENKFYNLLEEIEKQRLNTEQKLDDSENISVIECKRIEAKKLFMELYEIFVESRSELIQKLRSIADECVEAKKSTNTSTTVSKSGPTLTDTAVKVATAVCPPLLIPGMVVAGIGKLSGKGTKMAKSAIHKKNLLKQAEVSSTRDLDVSKSLERVYEKIQLSSLLEIETLKKDETNFFTTNSNASPLHSKKGSASGKSSGSKSSALRAIGKKTVGVTCSIAKGVAREALGDDIMDGIKIGTASKDPATDACPQIAKTLRDFADVKEEELMRIRAKMPGLVMGTGLKSAPGPDPAGLDPKPDSAGLDPKPDPAGLDPKPDPAGLDPVSEEPNPTPRG